MYVHRDTKEEQTPMNIPCITYADVINACNTAELLAAWQPYITSIDNWQNLVATIAPRKTGCGVVYELANPIERPHENVALVDMSGIHFSEPHYHKETEIYFVLQGSGIVVVGGKEEVVQKGSAIIIPPYIAHFVIPERDLVIAVVNNPPFVPESYKALTESNHAVQFNQEQFIRLTKKHEKNILG